MDRIETVVAGLSHLDLEGQIVDKEEFFACGSTCDVYIAWSKKHRMKVAVKRFRVFMRDDVTAMKVNNFYLLHGFALIACSLLVESAWRKRLKFGRY